MKSIQEQNEAGVIVAICIFLSAILIVISFISPARAQVILPAFVPDTPIKVEKLADAIYHAEGGKNAKRPYGILSVSCDSEHDCRVVCKNTIRNNIQRWINSGRTERYLVFLRNRFAPLQAGNDLRGLNKNWVRLVKYFLNNPKKVGGR